MCDSTFVGLGEMSPLLITLHELQSFLFKLTSDWVLAHICSITHCCAHIGYINFTPGLYITGLLLNSLLASLQSRLSASVLVDFRVLLWTTRKRRLSPLASPTTHSTLLCWNHRKLQNAFLRLVLDDVPLATDDFIHLSFLSLCVM